MAPRKKKVVVDARFSYLLRRRRTRTTPLSILESQAWSARPYGCVELDEAVKIAERRKSEGFNDDGSFKRRVVPPVLLSDRATRRAAEPLFCKKDKHPLLTGRPGAVYNRNDFVAPITDGIDFMVERSSSGDVFGFFEPVGLGLRPSRGEAAPPSEQRAEERELASAAGERVAGGGHSKYLKLALVGWKCPCCENEDVSLQVRLKEATVCRCGYVVSPNEMVSTHREKLGAEEGDDATQHADRVFDKKFDRFDRPAATTAERRKQRDASGKVSNVATRVKGLGRICDAARLSDRQASKDNRASEVDSGLSMTVNEERRLFDTLRQLDAMFLQLAPVDDAVSRKVRILADKLYRMSVRHCRTCHLLESCDVRLKERNEVVVAAAVFELVVERLIRGDDEIAGTTVQHLTDLQERCKRSPVFTNQVILSQMSTTKAMILILNSFEFRAETPCSGLGRAGAGAGRLGLRPSQPLKPGEAPPRPTRLGPTPKSTTQTARGGRGGQGSAPPDLPLADLGVRGGAPPRPTPDLGGAQVGVSPSLKESILRVFVAHRSDLPTSVRDGALRAVETDGFMLAFKKISILKHQSSDATALCLLNSVLREQSQANSPSLVQSTAKINRSIALKLNLDLVDAELAISKLRKLLPRNQPTSINTPFDDDDNLFV